MTMRRTGPLTVVVALAVALSACAAVNVQSLPQPGNTYSTGYDVVMEFDNVLNLPDRAKILLDGRTIGVATDVAIARDRVDVAARISPDVVIPANIHASMQQATVLGDIYIALDRPPSDGQSATVLGPGSRLPKSQTTSPPQLEDTIANMANFVSSGSIQRIQNTIIGINGATPSGDGAVRRIASRFATDMSDLSDNMDQVDLLLNGVAQTAQVAHDRIASYQHWFSPDGFSRFQRIFFILGKLGVLLPTLGSIYSGGFWLVPFLTSTADAAGAIRTSKRAFESEVHQWRRLFTDEFLPQDKYPAINITSIVGPDGRELSNNVGDVLRILGAMP